MHINRIEPGLVVVAAAAPNTTVRSSLKVTDEKLPLGCFGHGLSFDLDPVGIALSL
jgi:hypothetical protein